MKDENGEKVDTEDYPGCCGQFLKPLTERLENVHPVDLSLDDDYHYNLIKTGQHDRYWDEV